MIAVFSMASPGPPLLSQKTTVSPFKVWRSKLPKEIQHKDRIASPKKKSQTQSQPQPQTQTHGRPSLLCRSASSVSASDLSSVKNSDLARSTMGDHVLKLLRQLEGTEGADYVSTYREFRKNLMKKNDPIKMAKLSQPKKNLAKFKMAARLIQGKKFAFLSKAQLNFPSQNPEDVITTSLMKKIHQMKLEAGLLQPESEPEAEPRRRRRRRRAGSRGGGGGMETDEEEGEEDISSRERQKERVREQVAEPILYDDTMDSEKEKEVEKMFKYVVGTHANSPFTAEVLPLHTPLHISHSSSGGAAGAAASATGGQKKNQKKGVGGVKETASMRDLRNKGFIKNAQALRTKKIRADKKAAAASAQKNKPKHPETKNTNQHDKSKKEKKRHSHPYQAHSYSEHIKQVEEKAKAKHPEKLRQACDQKYDLFKDPSNQMRVSEITWTRLKAKENDLEERESLTILGSLSQPFSPSHSQSLLQQPSSPGGRDRNKDSWGPESLLEEEKKAIVEKEKKEKGVEEDRSPGRPRAPPAADSSNLISGDALLYSLEREGLFTVDDLDDLSFASEEHVDEGEEQRERGRRAQWDELVQDGSAADFLFPTLDLLELDVGENDPVLLLDREEGGGVEGGEGGEGGKTPGGVLAASLGTLLCSPQLQQEVSTRPASASRLGGVSTSSSHRSPQKLDLFSYHQKYSMDSVMRRRPESANTSPHVRSSADFQHSSATPNHVQKKRLIINRHHSPEVWIS